MTQPFTILVIDDEKPIRRMLKLGLEGYGYRVLEAATASEGIRSAVYPLPDIIVLDLVLPDRSGLEVLRQLREFTRTPVIVISALTSDEDKVALLDAGADDYLTKPFSMNELLARIRVARRHVDEKYPDRTYDLGPIHVDPAERSVTVDGQFVHLTPTEYALLVLFLEHKDRMLTREQIMRHIWGGETNAVNSLRVHLTQLRKKLRLQGDDGPFLETSAGVGYSLRSKGRPTDERS